MIKSLPSPGLLLLVAILALSGVAYPQDTSSPVNVTLSLADRKNTYRIGESTTLVLSFTSSQENYSVDTFVDGADTYLDEISISPTKGVFSWYKEFRRGAAYISDSSSPKRLSSQPIEVKLPLNSLFRFDLPGRYAIRVKTKRAHSSDLANGKFVPPLELTTNEISFDVRPMSETEEAAEAARIGAALDASKDRLEQIRLADQLSYLAGDAAVPEKIKRFFSSREGQMASYAGSIRMGLFISRNRALVIKMLEQVFNDEERPVDSELVGTLVSLKAMELTSISGKMPETHHPSFPVADDDRDRANQYYLEKLIESLPKRTGNNLTTAAITILQMLPRTNRSAETLATIRGILIKYFDSIDIYSREYLLNAYWEQLRDPTLIPSLERMLKDNSYPQYGRINVHTTALKRLSELDQIRARPFVIAEISDPTTIVYDEAFDSYKEAELPEVDQPLLLQISKYGQSSGIGRDSVFLRNKCLRAARFATAAIYDPLMEVYRTNASKWQLDSRAILLGYFARYRPNEALSLVAAEITTVGKERLGSVLNDFTRVNYPPEVAEFVEKRLGSDDPDIAGEAAYLISQHGSEADRSKIEARLKQWQSNWEKKYFELEGPNIKPENSQQAQLQVSLIMALLLGKEWKLTDYDKNELRSHCLTQTCKQAFHW